MSIYTRTGDTGTTSLFGGKRVLKCEELVEAYGSLDEFNSWLGLISSKLDTAAVQQFLGEIQKDLLAIGSSLSGWPGLEERTLNKRLTEIEARIDELETKLPRLKNFIIPGGSELGSLLHIARSICRRIERQIVSLAQKQQIQGVILKYFNRLSDFLFMLARFVNHEENIVEVTWIRD